MRQIFYPIFLTMLVSILLFFNLHNAFSQEQKVIVLRTTCLKFDDAKKIVDAYADNEEKVPNQVLLEMIKLGRCIDLPIILSSGMDLTNMRYYREKGSDVFFIMPVNLNDGTSAYSILDGRMELRKQKYFHLECTPKPCKTAGLSPALFL